MATDEPTDRRRGTEDADRERDRASTAPPQVPDTSPTRPEKGGPRAPRPTSGHTPSNSTENTQPSGSSAQGRGRRDAPRQSGATGGEPPPPRPDASTPAPGPRRRRKNEPIPDDADTVEVLFDTDPGRWQITTAASVYVLDLDRRTAQRLPGAGPFAEGQLVGVNSLEHDNLTVDLDELKLCVLGLSMLLFTEPRPDGTRYTRISTPVIEIRRLPDTAGQRPPTSPHDARGAP